MDYKKYKELQIQKENRILTVTINRPEDMNAVNEQLHIEFSTIFIDAEYDDDVDIIILTGAGKAFCAGGDLKWLLRIHGDPVETAYHINHDRKIQNAMLDMEKPIIAKVNGPAVGLGCSLALFCDFIYATPRSKFADPHVSVGLVAGDGGCVIWPQLIGYARAKKYLLTGDLVSANDALDMGLITEVMDESEIDAAVQALAEKLRDGAKYSIRWTKTSINAGLKVMANSIIDRAAAFENVTQLMEDHKIALEAFAKKENPKFKQK
jgi:enoyl-CoA hydratase|tara:strand:- start:214 stop:1008 length:795 start_codon:yes stop_codon:yes gene_type:complete